MTGTARTYTLVNADAGLKIKASVTGVGAGRDRRRSTPRRSSARSSPPPPATRSRPRSPISLKSSTGKVLAKTSASVPKAGGQATVTVKPAAGLKGGYRAWACPTARPQTGSRAPSRSRSRPRRRSLKVAVDAGERVRVVVAKSGR